MELVSASDGRYREYERLIIERDDLRKEAAQIWTTYNAQFGQLITDVFQLKVECIKRKKILAYFYEAVNIGGVVDVERLNKHIDREMEEYYAELARMVKEAEDCRNAGQSAEYDVKRSKELYHRLVKLFHPDIFPETDRQEKLKELWNRTVEAYGRNDCKELSELEVLVRKALSELGEGEIQVGIPGIEEKISGLKTEIYEISHTEPYIFRYILEDESKAEEKRAELMKEQSEFSKYLDKLCGKIENMIQSGDIDLLVKWGTD